MDRAEGVLIWVKLTLLTIGGVIIPVTIPARYVPFDPEVRLNGGIAKARVMTLAAAEPMAGPAPRTNCIYPVAVALLLVRPDGHACVPRAALDCRHVAYARGLRRRAEPAEAEHPCAHCITTSGVGTN